MKKIMLIIFIMCNYGLLSGCASIVNRSDEFITISSEPDNAEITIKNSDNMVIHRAKTPTMIKLPKSDGSYFGGERYSVSIKKDGYAEDLFVIDSSVSGWYLFGNIGFGGLIGWFIVDPLTGAMYNLEPNRTNRVLSKN